MATPTESRQLSSSLMGMKFMQRQREKEEQQRLEKEEQRAITESHWRIQYKEKEEENSDAPRVATSFARTKSIPSLLAFESAGFHGRQSFRQFNKEIESLAYSTAEKQQSEREEEQEKRMGVSDEQMAGWYAKRGEQQPNGNSKTAKDRKKRQNKRTRSDEKVALPQQETFNDSKRRNTKEVSAAVASDREMPIDARGDGFLKPSLSANDE
ncbi:hypothetical protein BDF19DRAFT_430052 [Syncephalis fuscata]|nr:hypothetical protein BDF19DRAFT_430052 [Syncephalis fuscata]